MKNLPHNFFSHITHLGSADLYIDDVIDNIDQVHFFQHFDKSELRVLSKYLDCFGAPCNYTLFKEGYASHYLIMILSGEAALKSVNGHSYKLSFGTTIGGISLVEPYLWEATCITTKPTDVAVMTKESLNQILLHHPRLGNKVLLNIIELMSAQYRQSVMNHSIQPSTIEN
jgi:CRP-like cAMP-binding protein